MTLDTKKESSNIFAWKKNIITGIFIMLPLVLSITIMLFIINTFSKLFRLDNFSIWLIDLLGLSLNWKVGINTFLLVFTIILIAILTYIIGFLARYIFIRKLIGFFEQVVSKIPIFNKIYAFS